MPSRSNRWLPLAGLGALVVLNVVLIALLLARPTVPDASSESTPLPTPSPQASAPEEMTTPPEKADPGELPEPDDTSTHSPANRLIVNADDAIAWRATVGDCATPGVLEHTTDQGETWRELPLDLAPVSRLRVLNP